MVAIKHSAVEKTLTEEFENVLTAAVKIVAVILNFCFWSI